MGLTAPSSELRNRERTRFRLVVRGAVQGVGFRPFVYRCATALGLVGWVENTPEGVIVEVEGAPSAIRELIATVRTAPPPNAVVAAIETRDVALRHDAAFTIRASTFAGMRTAELLPDLATCEECLAELLDPADRRYLYPFINCTHCGPRYSIIEDLPYDRERTSMRRFTMCRDCRAEYEDPDDRRFHAEPIACPTCGPRLALWSAAGETLEQDHDALQAAAVALRQGNVVAVKGIGGFHLMVDARNEGAVHGLRLRKRRPDKPFAVMFPALDSVREYCRVSAAEESLLLGPARPIVLLRRGGGHAAQAVAPGNPFWGAILPYAPLHHLLMRELGFPVVATSGNLSDEPIAIDEKDAVERLSQIADHFLVHDRRIVRPVDDSVLRVVSGRELVLRRGRGHAPASIAAKGVASGILALGGHLKATVALSTTNRVILGPHIGDLETPRARSVHVHAVADLRRLQGAEPRIVAHDMHPDYASSRAAGSAALPAVAVQHHLAHAAGCLAENGIVPPALGVAWDGMGYGTDGTVWGGEFMLITQNGWRRVAHLRRFRLPGGDKAAREPCRSAIGLLHAAFGDRALAMQDLLPIDAFSPAERAVLLRMLSRGVNAPRASSAGRLFDAFASICGLRQHSSYEGQAAFELEWSAADRRSGRRYPFPVHEVQGPEPMVIDWQPALETALVELRAGVETGDISEALHAGLADAIVAVAQRVGQRRVALTGGCFQNARLTECAVAALRAAGFEPVWHRQVPPNDGGLAFGQAVWTGWAERWVEAPCA